MTACNTRVLRNVCASDVLFCAVQNLTLVERVRELAAKKGCTPGQLALAWLLNKDNVFPIPGTKQIK